MHSPSAQPPASNQDQAPSDSKSGLPPATSSGLDLPPPSIYFTTPIYYVNGNPHVGHAYTAILGDVMTRYYRQRGFRARYLTGTDEHGDKIAQSAARLGTSPRAFVDQISERFRALWPSLNVHPDDFIRTTEERHKRVVCQVLQQLYDAGEIYKGEYRGLYCTGCERFITEKELVGGLCPDHGTAPQEVVEENYLFRMEKHRQWLREELERNPSRIEPERYRLEVLAILREPIGDLSISRPIRRVSWGIPMPFDPEHVVYVWFDALFNYVSALGGPGAPLYEALWPTTLHLLAKDIVKQHGIFWPIMLHAAGLPLFRGLRVHGYWLVDATKMSKSLGNTLAPGDLAARYGLDALRYYLMRDMNFGSDADFSELALASRLNSDLANDLGNLLSRVLTMIQRYCNGHLPSPGQPGTLEFPLVGQAQALPSLFDQALEQLQLAVGLESVLQLVRRGNQYVQDARPWSVAKEPDSQARIDTILYHAAEVLRLAAVLLHPVMPERCAALLMQLGCAPQPSSLATDWARQWGGLPVGAPIAPGEVLFPRVDLEALRKDLPGTSASATASSEASSAASGSSPSRKPGPPGESSKPQAQESRMPHPSSPASPGAPEELAPGLISIDDFARVQLRVAKVVQAEAVPKASRLLKLSLEVGDERRTVVSGIAEHYAPGDLVGRSIILVSNLKPAKLRGIESQGMILAASDESGRLALVTLDREMPSGAVVR